MLATRSRALDEGADPHRVPEHRLLRQPRLRRRGGGPDLLRDARARRCAVRRRRCSPGSCARRPRTTPSRHPTAARDAAQPGARGDARAEADLADRLRDSPSSTALLPDGHKVAAAGEHRAASRRTSRSTSSASSSPASASARTFGGGLKVYTTIDLKMQAAGARRRCNATLEEEGARRARSSRSTRAPARSRRSSAGATSRKQPVQHRDPGAAPAGLGVQAVRAAAALEEGIQPATTFNSKPAGHQPRQRPALGRAQRHAAVQRAGSRSRRRRRSRTTPSTRS